MKTIAEKKAAIAGETAVMDIALLERSPAVRRIRDAATRGTLSHALLLTGEGDLLPAARYAAAALECVGNARRPCGACPACRKVLRDIHPDVITVRDDAHQSIAADVIREVRADAWIRPNEGTRKVYLFPDCALLTERDQNILLKLVEEGPPYAAFVFCAENAAAVLQTIRSRCVEWKLPALETINQSDSLSRTADFSQKAKQFRTAADSPQTAEASKVAEASAEREAELCRRIVRRRGAVAEFAARLEKSRLSREELADLLFHCRERYAAALFSHYGWETALSAQEFSGRTAFSGRDTDQNFADRNLVRELAGGLTKRQIASTIEILGKYGGVCAWNVGTGHVLGALAAELEELR